MHSDSDIGVLSQQLFKTTAGKHVLMLPDFVITTSVILCPWICCFLLCWKSHHSPGKQCTWAMCKEAFLCTVCLIWFISVGLSWFLYRRSSCIFCWTWFNAWDQLYNVFLYCFNDFEVIDVMQLRWMNRHAEQSDFSIPDLYVDRSWQM